LCDIGLLIDCKIGIQQVSTIRIGQL